MVTEEQILDKLKDIEFDEGMIIPVYCDYGWFGTSMPTQTEEEYIKEYLELLEKHKEDYLVTLDCHV